MFHAHEGVGLNTPIEHGSEARFDGVHFSGPPHFGSLGTFFGFFAEFGSYSPKKTPMRSSKAPPIKKK